MSDQNTSVSDPVASPPHAATNTRTPAEYPPDIHEHDETSSLLRGNQPSNPKYAWLEKLGLEPSDFTWKNLFKALALLAFVITIICLAIIFHVQDYVRDVLHYIEKNREYGIIIYISVYAVCVWTFLPGSIISIAAGFLFRPLFLAGLIIITGDLLGALGTFLFGRYIFSDWVKKQIDKRPVFLALNSVIAEEGWKIVVMLRLTPLPFNLVSYFFSVSCIKLFPFLWATALGVLPGTFNAVWIGSLVKSLSGIDQPKLKNQDIVIITMNFILVGCCVIALSVFGKKALRKAMYDLQTSKEAHQAPHEEQTPNPPSAASGEGTVVEEEPLSRTTSPGFTHGEKIVLFCMLGLALLNITICLPLYFHFRDIESKKIK